MAVTMQPREAQLMTFVCDSCGWSVADRAARPKGWRFVQFGGQHAATGSGTHRWQFNLSEGHAGSSGTKLLCSFPCFIAQVSDSLLIRDYFNKGDRYDHPDAESA